jgi:hypothetical protein
MSDPIAVSILAKLTSWYPFDGDLTDAHGANDLTGAVVAGYAAGKVGDYLLAGSRALDVLASPIAITATTGNLTVGGWFKYTSAVPLVAPFGLTFDPGVVGGSNEMFYIYSQLSDGGFGAFGWLSGGGDIYGVADDDPRAQSYPITVRVTDSDAQTASSNQIIHIANSGGLTPGWYFVVATWNAGNMTLYVDSTARDTSTPPASVNGSSVTHIQVANAHGATVSDAGLDECFFCDGAAMTQQEVTWLYNFGAGRSYADVVTAAG